MDPIQVPGVHESVERLNRSYDASQLIGAAQEARNTANRLAEVGCTGAAADCRILAESLDRQAGEILAQGEGSDLA